MKFLHLTYTPIKEHAIHELPQVKGSQESVKKGLDLKVKRSVCVKLKESKHPLTYSIMYKTYLVNVITHKTKVCKEMLVWYRKKYNEER